MLLPICLNLIHNTYKILIFIGSTRRDIKPQEVTKFLRVFQDSNPGFPCAAFRVAQKDQRFLVATSRHCFDFNEQEACEKNQIRVASADSKGSFYFGSCKRIVVRSEQDDLFIMEIQIRSSSADEGRYFESKIKEIFPSYSLADYQAQPGTPLVIFGFPSDLERKGQPTVSEKCEILPNETRNPIDGLSESERQTVLEFDQQENNLLSNFVKESLKQLQIKTLKHNCSVYLGNSGGPALIEGTNDVVGVPFKGWREFFKPMPRYFGLDLESTAGFVERHRKTLEAEGLSISDQVPKTQIRKLPTPIKKHLSI